MTTKGTNREATNFEAMNREATSRDLAWIATWISANFEAAKRKMKPIRSSEVLRPGVYFNVGTRMVDRVHSPQRVALGSRMFRITKDPGASAAEIRKSVGNPDGRDR